MDGNGFYFGVDKKVNIQFDCLILTVDLLVVKLYNSTLSMCSNDLKLRKRY